VNHNVVASVSGNKGCEKYTLKVRFCYLDRIVEDLGIVFFLDLQDFLFGNLYESRIKKNVMVVEC